MQTRTLSVNTGDRPGASGRPERGSATVVFIALMAIMMILVTAEVRALIQLHCEVKLVEQQQIKRLNQWQTNAPAIARPDSK